MERGDDTYSVRPESTSPNLSKIEKGIMHNQMWADIHKYYDHFDAVNHHIEEWTSPRYYSDKNKEFVDMKNQKEKEDLLLKRKEDLAKTLEEEAQAFKQEGQLEKADKKKTEIEESHSPDREVMRHTYKEKLDEHVEELEKIQKIAEKIQIKGHGDFRKKSRILCFEDMQLAEEKRRREKECELCNITQHKLKLIEKAKHIDENLAKEKELVRTLEQLKLDKLVEDERKREEVKQNFEAYAKLVETHHELEKERQRHLEFVIESEAKQVLEKQLQLWETEEEARQRVLNGVLELVKTDIDENLEKNIEHQKSILEEREEYARKIEEYCNEIERLNLEIEQRGLEKKNIHARERDEELDSVMKEEEYLKQELAQMTQQAPVKPDNTHRFF